MFHQPHNTFGNRIYNSFTYKNLSYEKHFHKSFEAWFCRQGKIEATCDNVELTLIPGDFLIVFPYVAHSFNVSEDSRLWVGVFSGDYVPELEKIAAAMRPEVKVFRAEKDEMQCITSFLIRSVSPGELQPDSAEELSIKSGIYALASAFLANAVLVPQDKSDDISTEIIRYIEKNYTQNINLKTMADELGYNYQHLSRVFRKTMKMNFRDLINQYRFDRACAMLHDEKITVTQAALDSGFQSVRNFNRIYKEKTGLSPKNETNRKMTLR